MKKSSSKKAAPEAPAKATANKAVSRKTVSKKATVKGTANTTTTAKKKAAAPKAAAKPAANRRTITRKTASKKATARKAAVPVEELPTEEIWAHYQKARKKSDAQAVEHIRNILMERHFPLVKYIAERLLQTLPKSIELDDLVSAGLFGLMDAIRGFDPERGIKFKTYCTTRIRGSILDQLRSQDWVPRLVRLKASKIDKTLQRLTAEYGREPTHSELAEALELSHSELAVEIGKATAKSMYSLSDRWEDRDDDSSLEKVDVLEDKKSIDPTDVINKSDLMSYMTRSLTHKERFIIEQYYRVGHTMREIGEMLSLTESRVCQIHTNVMNRLKEQLDGKTGTLLS